MTQIEAQGLHDRLTAAGAYVTWLVISQPPGQLIGRAMVADHSGGHQEGGDLIADTIEDLRAMLPARLTRWSRTMMMGPKVMETWD